MRFQTKVKDYPLITQLLQELAASTESSYLWCHHEGRLVIYDAHLTKFDQEKKKLIFKIPKTTNRLPLTSLTSLNLFHESLLMIFRSPIITHESDFLELKIPDAILKLAQAEDFLPELMSSKADGDKNIDKNDLELISQVLEVINKPKREEPSETPGSSGPTYVFAKKPEVKETTGAFAFSNKGVVEDSTKSNLDEKSVAHKKMRIAVSRQGLEPAVYQLLDVETNKVVFQTSVKGEFKEGDEITIHSIYDNPLSNPLKAKIIIFSRPSEYAKTWRVEAKYNEAKETPKVKKKEIEKVGLKRILAQDTFSHEVLYILNDMNTNGIILTEKRNGEFTVGDKLIVCNLYGSPLKKPITALIKSIQNANDGRLVTLEFLKPED